MDFGTLIGNYGFPAALAVYLLIDKRRSEERLFGVLKDYQKDSLVNTDVLNKVLDYLSRAKFQS